MLARLRKAVEENEEGFTLIELLVVMIIIGILAAIAIPVFLNQRKKAVDSSMKSDLRTISTNMETLFQDKNTYSSTDGQSSSGGKLAIGTSNTVTLSDGNVASIVAGTDAFCIKVVRDAGKSASSFENPQTQGWVYISNAGGIQDSSKVTDCSSFAKS